MMNFDLRPIMIVVAILSLMLGTFLLNLNKQSNYIKGTVYWAIGCFCSSASLVTISLYPLPALYINLIFFNLFLIGGQCLILIGILKFKGKKVNYVLIGALPFFSLLQITVFTLFYNEPGIRMAINSFLYAIYSFYAFTEMLYPPTKALTFVFRANSIVFFMHGVCMLGRAFVGYSLPSIDFLSITPLNTTFFILMSGLYLVSSYGFIIMVNTRLAEDLRKQLSVRHKLLSIIAHDLRSSLNVVGGFSDLLSRSIEDFEVDKSKQFAGYIKQSAIQMNGLLSNLLEWATSQARAGIFVPEELDIRELIHEEISLNSSISSNKQIAINYDESIPLMVTADRNMLKTILRNLIINAIKYTNPGGVIKISTKEFPKYAEVSVSDSGIGIEPHIISKLFKEDEQITTTGTAKEIGSGLGLLLCKEFVEKHKGKIWVESVVEKGSTFKFTLPRE